MAKSTAGPWEARELLADGMIVSKRGWEISTDDYDVATFIPGRAPFRKKADAVLAAAAPDLLAACERGGIEERDMKGPELLRLAARYLGEYGDMEVHWLLNRKADAEEAAIAKAKGDSDA